MLVNQVLKSTSILVWNWSISIYLQEKCSILSSKGPTCALIKPDGKTLDSFGFEAENKYSDLAEEGEHEQWYFFKRFKMMLFDKIVSSFFLPSNKYHTY